MESNSRQPRTRRSVFVSSTSRDLISHRQQVSDTLLRLSLFPVAMEQFGAQGSGNATSVSTNKVAEAEVYLGIFAWRYGFIPPGETRSVTHLEYLEARRLGLPCYLFLAHPDTDQDDALFPASLRDPEHRTQLLAFRDELQQSVVDYFTTPDDLARKIAAPLSDYMLQKEREELLKGPRPPRDLPPRTIGFVGREQEVRDLCAALRQGQSVARASAVSGMGGVGKSALVAEGVHLLAAEPGTFPGGFTFVRCDERRDLPGLVWVYDQLLSAWNITLAPEELGGATSPEAEVALRERALRTRLRPAGNEPRPPALVLLDNVERELPLTRALETLAALTITALLTTRTEFRAPRLKLVKLDVLEPAAALTLFQQQYTDLSGDWDATRNEAPAAAIVKALGYLPLAIELAAPRAAEIGLAALAQEVQQPGVLAQLQDVLDAQRSVRYLLGKSLASLTPTQQARFSALGLPSGHDWPRLIIEQMLSAVVGPPGDAAPASADLSLLARLSLVKLLPASTPSETPRVRLHPLLRELAREEWAKQPEEAQNAALMALLESIQGFTREQKQNFATLALEEDLIVGAIRYSGQKYRASNQLIKIIDNLHDYLTTGSHWQLGMELFTLHLDLFREMGDRRNEGIALNNLGHLTDRMGRPLESASYFQQALMLAQGVGSRDDERSVLNNLGHLASSLGYFEAANNYYQLSLSIAREMENKRGEALVLNNLGDLAHKLGHLDEAASYYKHALLIRREEHDQSGEATTLNNIGLLLRDLGRLNEARRHLEQALTIILDVGDRAVQSGVLNNLGDISEALKDVESAESYYKQSLAIAQEIGDQRGVAITLCNLGHVAVMGGRQEEAEPCYGQALAIQRQIPDPQGAKVSLDGLIYLAKAKGQLTEQVQYFEELLSIQQATGDQSGEVTTLNNLGFLAMHLKQNEKSARYYEQALDIAHQIGDRKVEGTILHNLGGLADRRGRKEDAARYFRQALARFNQEGDLESARVSLKNLARLQQEAASPSKFPKNKRKR